MLWIGQSAIFSQGFHVLLRALLHWGSSIFETFTMTATAIGIIGIGAMGMGMARSLVRNGVPTWVRDVREVAHEEAMAFGAGTCSSAAELAKRCRIVATVVVDAAQTEEVLFGEAGAVAAATPGTTFVVSSTLDADYVAGVGARLSELGMLFVDAPISGGPKRAAEGTMTTMIAGSPAALAATSHYFPRIAGRIFTISERAGDAARVKLVNNMLAAANLAAGAEALALGTHLGLDQKMLFDVICASSGGSWMFTDRMGRVVANDPTVTAAMPILTKDVGLAMDMARKNRFPVPVGALAHSSLLAGLALGLHERDDAGVYRVYERFIQPTPKEAK